jgi:hypothetical protein
MAFRRKSIIEEFPVKSNLPAAPDFAQAGCA